MTKRMAGSVIGWVTLGALPLITVFAAPTGTGRPSRGESVEHPMMGRAGRVRNSLINRGAVLWSTGL